jgi:hypothetical protein
VDRPARSAGSSAPPASRCALVGPDGAIRAASAGFARRARRRRDREHGRARLHRAAALGRARPHLLRARGPQGRAADAGQRAACPIPRPAPTRASARRRR